MSSRFWVYGIVARARPPAAAGGVPSPGLLSAVRILGKLAAVPDGRGDAFGAAQGLLAWVVGERDARANADGFHLALYPVGHVEPPPALGV
jgi:hypothetical protein